MGEVFCQLWQTKKSTYYRAWEVSGQKEGLLILTERS